MQSKLKRLWFIWTFKFRPSWFQVEWKRSHRQGEVLR